MRRRWRRRSSRPARTPAALRNWSWSYTNSALTNLAADWYLGVPNHEVTNISYTILAVIETNGYFPAFPGATGAGGGAAGGGGPSRPAAMAPTARCITSSTCNDSGPGSLRDARQLHQPHRGL